MKKTTILLLTLLMAGLQMKPAAAFDDSRHGYGHGRSDRHHRHHAAPHHNVRINGHWVHGRHGTRLGWWWVVGNSWSYYPKPVYPHPFAYQTPVVIVQHQTPVYRPAALPPIPQDGTARVSVKKGAKQYWYYCPDPAGYYPYVQGCDVEWRKVPTSPAGIRSSAGVAPPPPY